MLQIAILAAGLGKRMRSTLPKVLHPLAGRPLLSHVIDTAKSLQPSRIGVVYGHGGELVRKPFATADLLWAKQEPQLGTGHAVMQALPHFAEDGICLVLYGDVPLIRPDTLRRLLDQCVEGELALLTATVDDPTGYGRIVRDAGDRVMAIVEDKDATTEQRAIKEINTGILAVPMQQLKRWLSQLNNNNAQAEYYLTGIVASAVAEQSRVRALRLSEATEAMGINSKAELAQAERIFQRRQAEVLLSEGVTLADASRFDLRGSLRCGQDVLIDVGCIFEGEVSLADNVSIGAYCVLKNAQVAAGSHIAPFSHIEGARIGAHCRIGPYARIRPGTELDADVHIGNFVEVKNSQFGVASKANHLAYVGDATVGREVNIGAGTITCNYDGANKHRTIIEDEVHIGSDTQLVAPVTIGKGATIGAGTTVWKNVPPQALTVNEKTQLSRLGWQRPKKKG